LVIFAETLSGFWKKSYPNADSPKTFGFRRRPGSESLQKEGTGGSLIIFKMFEERNRWFFDCFQSVWRKEPVVL
jgi:hypothetical protein